MKKLFLIPALFSLLLCGCTPDKDASKSDGANNNGTTTVALTKENLDTYFNITQTGTYGTYRQDYTISFKGVLTFAVYENVVITLNMHIYGEGDDLHYLSKNNDYERQLKLNAAGEGTSVLSYEDGKIDGVVYNVFDDGVEPGLGYKMAVESITLSEGFKQLAFGFNQDMNLKIVKIPSSLEKITCHILVGCVSFEKIEYNGTKAQWEAIEKDEYWNYLAKAFIVVCKDGNIEIPAWE